MAQGRGQFVAIGDWHVDVGQDQVEPPGQPLGQRLFTIVGNRDGTTQRFQLFLDDRLVDRIVFSHQYPQVQGQGLVRHRCLVLGVAPLLRQVDRPGDSAHIVGIDFPALGRMLRRVTGACGGDNPRSGPGRFVAQRQHIHQQCRGRCRFHLGTCGPGLCAQAIEPGAQVLRQLLGRSTHANRRSARLERRAIGQLARSALKCQLQGKTAAQARFADDLELAGHQFTQPPANCQAQPCTGFTGGVAHLVERIEQLRLLGLGNTDARVADLPLQAGFLATALQYPQAQHHPAVIGELDRVAQEVIEDLPDAQRIAAHPVRECGVNAGIELQPLGLGGGAVGAHGVFGQFQGAEVLGFQGHLPGLDLRHVQYIADQLEQGCRGTLDGVQVLLLTRLERRQPQQFEGAQHAVQRRADLVAHGRQEPGLGFVGRVGGFACLFQRHGVLDPAGDIMDGAQPDILAVIAGGNEIDVQVTAVDLKVGLPGAGKVVLAVEGVDQLGTVLPLLGARVLHQHLMIAAADHAQAGRRGVDDSAAERLAFGDALMRLVGRQHHPAFVPAVEGPAAAQRRQQRQQQAKQRPTGVIEETLDTDDVDPRPGLPLGAGYLEHQPVTVEVQPFMQVQFRLHRTDQRFAGGGDQGEMVVDRPLHDPLDVVDLGQVQQ
ncbi:hypothetical protein D3C80_641750 [compost metagenome]